MEFYLKVRILVNNWIIFTAFRHFKSKKSEKGDTSTFLSIIGILSGVMTMITVIGVMNGFQSGNIDKLIEIGSSHVVLEPKESGDVITGQTLAKYKEITTFYRSSDSITAASDMYNGKIQGIQVTSLPQNISDIDLQFFKMLNMGRDKRLDLSSPNNIVIGQSLAYNLNLSRGQKISIISLKSQEGEKFRPVQIEFEIVGIYRSGYRGFDDNLVFVSNESAEKYFIDEGRFNYKIKIKNRDRSKALINKFLQERVITDNYEIKSWKDFNTSYYHALKNEKNLMTMLIGLIFLVVGVNIFNSLRRSVYLRFEEISVLKTMGVSSFNIRVIFILESFFIGFIGATIGVFLGFWIANNINVIFDKLEMIINSVLALSDMLLGSSGSQVSLYGPQYFYISEVPVKIYFSESIALYLSAIFTSVIAAYAASKRISTIKPGEVIRNE